MMRRRGLRLLPSPPNMNLFHPTLSSSSSSSSSSSPSSSSFHVCDGRGGLQSRSIFSTTALGASWFEKVKGVFTGEKTQSPSSPDASLQSFTLLNFADELKKARTVGSFTKFVVGRSSAATFTDAFKKQEAIIRYLASCDPSGENLQTSQKQNAAKDCNCTITDVENALAKFTWAKEAQKKVMKLKEEGKPMPKSFAEVKKLMGSTPLDLARTNLAQSGQISRNAMCPCGSKKKYKWCCGKS